MLHNVDTTWVSEAPTLKQRYTTSIKGCFNVAKRRFKFVSMLTSHYCFYVATKSAKAMSKSTRHVIIGIRDRSFVLLNENVFFTMY